jgi:hypothetical protein
VLNEERRRAILEILERDGRVLVTDMARKFDTFQVTIHWDFSVCKNFSITDRIKLEFRAEFFNVFNHPNLQFAKSGPQNSINTTTLGTPQFGFLTGARDPLQIHLALKLSFYKTTFYRMVVCS